MFSGNYRSRRCETVAVKTISTSQCSQRGQSLLWVTLNPVEDRVEPHLREVVDFNPRQGHRNYRQWHHDTVVFPSSVEIRRLPVSAEHHMRSPPFDLRGGDTES